MTTRLPILFPVALLAACAAAPQPRPDRPGEPEAPRTDPAHVSGALQFSPGASFGTLHGRRVAGGGLDVEFLGQPEPGPGWGGIAGLSARTRFLGDGEEVGNVTTLGLLAGAAHGRWRVYGGLEAGVVRGVEVGSGRRGLLGLAIGPRAGASVDLLRLRRADVFRAIDGTVATPDLGLASATLGMRLKGFR